MTAGLIEALSLVRDSPTGRAALIEAGFYAIVVDALACAGIVAVLGALFALILRLSRSSLSPERVAAFFVSGVAPAGTESWIRRERSRSEDAIHRSPTLGSA